MSPAGGTPPPTLTSHQVDALKALAAHYAAGERVVRLTGLAGTGKTWLLAAAPEWLSPAVGVAPGAMTVVTPTNRATMVLNRKLQVLRDAPGVAPLLAGTVDAMLWMPPGARQHCQVCATANPMLRDRDCHVADLVIRRAPRQCVCGDVDFGRARRPRPLTSSFIIVDEASMMTVGDLDELLGREASVRVLLVGDPGQLPPVNAESALDRPYPAVHLSQVIRQGEGSPVLALAHAVRALGAAGELTASAALTPDLFDHPVTGLATDPATGLLAGGELCVLAHRWADVTEWSARLRTAVLRRVGVAAPPPLLVGEPVRLLGAGPLGRSAGRRYKHATGIVTELAGPRGSRPAEVAVRMEDGQVLSGPVDLDALNLPGTTARGDWRYGYASTVHSAQGSEFRSVVYVHHAMDDPRLVYTALTRAKESLYLRWSSRSPRPAAVDPTWAVSA